MEAGLSMWHAEGTQSNKMTPFVFPSTLFLLLPNVLLAFFGCRCTLGWWSQATVNSDFRISFLGRDGQFHHQHQRALVWIIFFYVCYPTFIYTETLMPTACLLFSFVRSCRTLSLAWHLTALRRSGISIDLEILCTLRSAGCEWRCWIKPVSANTHCCLLSTIKALPFASHPLTYSQFKNELFLQILSLVSLLITKKKIKSKDSEEELLKWASRFYSPCIFLIQNRPPQIYSCSSACRKGDLEDTQLPWINLAVIF